MRGVKRAAIIPASGTGNRAPWLLAAAAGGYLPKTPALVVSPGIPATWEPAPVLLREQLVISQCRRGGGPWLAAALALAVPVIISDRLGYSS